MKNILIYGASGHSKMIVDILHKRNTVSIVGYIDTYKSINDTIHGYKVLGKMDDLSELIKKHHVSGIIIGIGDNHTRYQMVKKISKLAPQLEFISAVHPSVILADDICIPKGTVIMAGVVVNANANIGEFCILNTKASLGHDSVMSDFSSIASGGIIGGNVSIGKYSAICIGATVIQGISIGKHTVIGAAALVLKSIGDNKLAFGVPINTIKERDMDSKYLG